MDLDNSYLKKERPQVLGKTSTEVLNGFKSGMLVRAIFVLAAASNLFSDAALSVIWKGTVSKFSVLELLAVNNSIG